MLLLSAQVLSFKSIVDSNCIPIDRDVTVLVGQNESGKTAFLRALYKGAPVEENISYDITEDYPRKHLINYQKIHEKTPAIVLKVKYLLEPNDIEKINDDLGDKILESLEFSISYKYGGEKTIDLRLPNKQYLNFLLNNPQISKSTAKKLEKSESLAELLNLIKDAELSDEERSFFDNISEKFSENPSGWDLFNFNIWSKHIKPNVPKFLYFDEYKLLPGKINLNGLKQRFDENRNNNRNLNDEDKAVLGLLQLANIDLTTLVQQKGYESSKAQLEGVSISVTDRIFEFWTQSQDLEVEFDIKEDKADIQPFNQGDNLYIRIKSTRHRVSVPFDQRSKGFRWFFSFIVWFDSIKKQIGTETDLILLLDEPGLSLHALAQSDFLRYIDKLSENHQIVYTTHSPFMVPNDRLNRVRTVEDLPKFGTKITENISGSDPKTLFPLQAALGYSIAQNLFISKNNLLVEGPADLLYLQFFSNLLENEGKEGLREDITIVPVGGLDKIATFIALLRGNQLKMTVLHDYEKGPDQRLDSLVREKIIQDSQIFHYAMFRDANGGNQSSKTYKNSDVEDLFSPALYLQIFNNAYKSKLNNTTLQEEELPQADRIVKRIEQYLTANSIQIRPSGGFNHYFIAHYMINNPISNLEIDSKTLECYEGLFKKINNSF